jgi:hypothetical protein
MIEELIQMMTRTRLTLGGRGVPHRGRLISVPVIEVRAPDEFYSGLLRPLLEVIAAAIETAFEKDYGWHTEVSEEAFADGELRGHVGLLAGDAPGAFERGSALLEVVMSRLEEDFDNLRVA